MSARDVIEHALRVYYADSRDPAGMVGKLLAQYDAERRDEVLQAIADEQETTAAADDQGGWPGLASARRIVAVQLRRAAQSSEKSIPAAARPREDEATHRHTRPCEFPEVLCICPRPRGLSDADIIRARRLARVAEFFRSAGAARTRTWSAAS